MNLEKVIEKLKREYEKAKGQKWIINPLAYALYQVWKEVDSSPTQNQTSQTESIWVKYEVNVGGGCATGSVLVPENASDDDIKVAIMDDLYSVDYEKESIKDGIRYDENGLQFCPNCGCQAELRRHNGKKYYYECGECWTETNKHWTAEEAKEEWNKLEKGD